MVFAAKVLDGTLSVLSATSSGEILTACGANADCLSTAFQGRDFV
jgi:hypothetical protein